MDGLFDFLAKEKKPMVIICPEFRDEMDAPDEGAKECLLKDRMAVAARPSTSVDPQPEHGEGALPDTA